MRTKQELEAELERIDCQLSPENLFCDGEISRAQGRLKAARLLERRERIIAQLGQAPAL